jgi:hypothetical protein
MNLRRLALVSLGLLALAGSRVHAQANGWGDIKGQVVWGEEKLPVRPEINVTQDKAHCLMNGPLLAENETYVVDPKTKGVRWAMVWLVDAKDPKNPKAQIPIHPGLKNLKMTPVVLDQPCCAFEPHVLGLIEGQTLIAKNSSPKPHNVKIDGGNINPNLNQLLPPGAMVPVPGWNPTTAGAVPVSCSIHGWMKCHVRVFNHPYFAVTNEKGEFEIKDAPAGDFRLMIWQPTKGWLAGRTGMPITIKAKDTLDLGKIELKLDPAPK